MFASNPFADLTVLLSSIVMQVYIVLMSLAVAICNPMRRISHLPDVLRLPALSPVDHRHDIRLSNTRYSDADALAGAVEPRCADGPHRPAGQ